MVAWVSRITSVNRGAGRGGDRPGAGALDATGITAGTIICVTNLEDKFGEILDRNLDDGDAEAGDFQTDAGAAYDVAGGAVNNACRRI